MTPVIPTAPTLARPAPRSPEAVALQIGVDRERYPADPWRLIEQGTPDGRVGVTETLFTVGNGYLGFRGNQLSSDTAHEHGTFINGFHETFPIRHAERAFGFAEVGQTIVNAPDAKVIDVYVDDELLSDEDGDLLEYHRELDMKNGLLLGRSRWRTGSGKQVEVRYERMVCFADRHLTVTRVDVTMLDSDAHVIISSQVRNRQDAICDGGHQSAGFDPRKSERISHRALLPDQFWAAGDRAALSYRVAASGMGLGIGVDHVLQTTNTHSVETDVSEDLARSVYRIAARAGEAIRLTKRVSYHSSESAPTSELVDRCGRTLDRADEDGDESLFARQRTWMDDFWARSDIRIGDHDDLQQATRWCLFQLAQSAARADGRGIPAKGVSGSGYSGHYFWDTEIYVLPFMTYTSPQWARNALHMRFEMLPAARRRALQLNEAGALFPWRTINGEEASAYYAAGTAQYHINADISFALAKYVHATGDTDFLYREGVDIAVETARLWATLGFWREVHGESVFHIHGVTGPDEYTTVVNDNLFTNVMARFNLRFAANTVNDMAAHHPDAYRALLQRLELTDDEVRNWEVAAAAMHIPFSQGLGIHPQDATFLEREIWDLDNTPSAQRPLLLHFHPLVIYRYQVLKQADVVLALFLQGDQFTDAEKLADFEYYDPLTTGDSTLSAVVQSILAAEVGYRDLALDYFMNAMFVDIADLHRNAADGVHVASAGGVWLALVCGFGGMRDHGGALSFDPRLPAGWPELSFTLSWRGTRLDITVSRGALKVAAGAGDAVPFSVRGKHYVVHAFEQVEVTLDHQGPTRKGRPRLDRLLDASVDGGTSFSASIPPSSETH